MEGLNVNSLKSRSKNFVKHEGVVSKITNDVVTISLKGNMNCEACKAKAACGVSESNSKEIEVSNSTQSLKLNENVEVLMKKNLGLKAVFWAYVFPFILMLTVLLITSTLFEEWIAGLLSIAVLLPYYLMLYVLRSTFKKAFRLSILKMA
ncbi:MAG: SoxR reducing system RseC family protein [Eudoraea sp.]|uniref:SoxR reducing system RseC family protein n=1 Tax=Eudoraea sp. TaxID=1979955 RepID=UPI003C707ACF